MEAVLMDCLYPVPTVHRGNVYPYIPSDDEHRYAKNREQWGTGWRFYDRPFTYKLNRHGYRMNHELHETHWSNYILFLGCSYAFGTGLPLEETYAYRIAEHYGCDYINAAMNGGTPKFVILNLVKLLATAPAKPRAIHINWPPLYRATYWRNHQLVNLQPDYLTDNEHTQYWRSAYETTILEDSHVHNLFRHYLDTVGLLAKAYGIPIFQMSTGPHHDRGQYQNFFAQYTNIAKITTGREGLTNEQIESIDSINLLQARDLYKLPHYNSRVHAHPGVYHQDRVVEAFTKEIQL
jgi:hypothetical protein